MPGIAQGGHSVLRPYLELEKHQIQAIYDNAVALAVARVARDLKNNDPINVRALRPYDLGETNDVWNETVAGSTTGAWADSIIADQAIRVDTAIAIYGVYDASEYQAVTGARLQQAGTRLEWDFFPILTDDKRPEARKAYGMDPFVVGGGLNITIQYYTRPSTPSRTQSIEVIMLGIVAEKANRTINPRRG